MEDITLQRLQTEFDEVISQINDIVARKDIEAARKVLEQVAELVSNDEHVPLDDVEGYDHILHKLLDNIHGVIEIAEIVPNDPELQELINQRTEIENRIAKNNAEIDALKKSNGSIEIDASERSLLIRQINTRITRIRKQIENGGLSQEEIEQLTEQITELEEYHRELLGMEYTLGEVDTSEIDKQIAEKESEITDLEKKISALGEGSRETPEEQEHNNARFSPEVVAMLDEINNLRIQIASYDADIENFEAGFPGGDEMDRQEYEANIRGREEAQKRLDALLTRLKEISPEALDLSNSLRNLEIQLESVNADIEAYEEAFPSVSGEETRENARNIEEKNRLEQEIARLREALRPNLNPDRTQDGEFSPEVVAMLDEINNLRIQIASYDADIENFEAGFPGGDEMDRQEYEANIRGREEAQKRLDALLTRLKEISPEALDLSNSLRNLEIQLESVNADIEAYEDAYPSVDEEETREYEKNTEEKNRLEQEIARIKGVLHPRESSDRGSGEPGQDNDKAEERKKLEAELAQKKKELDDLNNQKKSLSKKRDKTKIVLEKESYIKMLEIKIKYLKMKLETAKKRGRTKEVESITQEISEIEVRINTAREGRTDNSDRISELEKENENLESRKKEIDERIKQIKEEKGIVGDRLDLEEEAHKIGDKIFKTAEIRKELENRGYTRDDFLSFYEQGREKTHQRINEIVEEVKKITADMKKEMGEILHDDETGVGLHKQLESANGVESERIKIYEKMRKNFISAGHEDWLTDIGITGEITTKEQADLIEALWNGRVKQYETALQARKVELNEHRQNLRVFDREIERINKEKEVVSISQGDIDSLLESSKKEKDLRKRQLRATMYGDEELEKEWDERIARFVSHKKAEGKEITYTDENGKQVTVKVDTVEDYPELGEDAYFLNIEDYKSFTEIVSLYDKKGLSAVKAVIDTSSHEYDEYRELVGAGKTAEADKWLDDLMAAKREYVNTYHGFTNQHAVKAAVLRTAGSTLDQMLPVGGNLPLQTKLKNGLINTGRFMMIKVPRFTRQDSDGNVVTGPLEVAGGLATAAMDGLIIVGLGATAFTGGLAGLAPAALYYGAKGIVTATNVLVGRHIQNKYSEEIKNNTPTLRKATSADREIARRAYYRDAERMSGIRSFFRAKLDRLPFLSARAKETEEKILKRQGVAIDATVDTRVDNIIIDSKENAKVADQNHKVRVARQIAETKSAGTYNDIVRDPDSVNRDQAAATIAQNAAIRAERPGAKRMDVNPTSTVERKDKYTKEEVEYGKTGDLREIVDEGGTATVASITEEQKHKAAKERQDLINAVSTIAVAGALKAGYEFLKGGFHREIEVPDPDGTKQSPRRVWKDKPVKKEVTKYRQETVYEVDQSKKLSDLKYTDGTAYDTYSAPISSNPVARGTDFEGVALKWNYKGKEMELSMGTPKFRPGRGGMVQHQTDIDIGASSPAEILKDFSIKHRAQYEEMLRQNGMDGAPIDDVVKAIDNGTIEMWTQTGKLEGWGQYLGGAVKSKTIDIEDGVETITRYVRDFDVVYDTVPDPDAVKKITTTILDPRVLIDALKDAGKGLAKGLKIGAIGSAIDNAQNIGSPVQHMNDGTIDRRTNGVQKDPSKKSSGAKLNYSRIATDAVDEYNKENGLGKYAKGGPKKEEAKKGEEHDEDSNDER